MDNLTIEQRKKNMTMIRSENTLPERIITNELKKKKIYFSMHSKKIMGSPDIIFRRKKAVVFIDSDFWHFNIKKFIMPKTNRRYWKKKIENNVIRDKLVNKVLKKDGWKIIRIWESEIKKNKEKCVNRILKALNQP